MNVAWVLHHSSALQACASASAWYAWRHGPVHAPCSTAVARRSAAKRAERTGMGCIIGYMG